MTMFPVALRMPEPGSLTHKPSDGGSPHYRQDVYSAVYVQGKTVHDDQIEAKSFVAKRPCVDEFVCSQGSALPVICVDGQFRAAQPDGEYSAPVELKKQVGHTVEQGRDGDLYFLQQGKDQCAQLAVRHADDGRTHTLFAPESGGISDIQMDAAGQSLLIGIHPAGFSATTEIVKFDLQTGQSTTICSDAQTPMSDFQLSHDGQLLAYTDAAEGRVYLRDLETDTLVPISAAEKRLPEPACMDEDLVRGHLQFSPDDSRIFYSREFFLGGAHEVHERRGELLVAPVQGGDIAHLMGSVSKCMPFAYEMQALNQPLTTLS